MPFSADDAQALELAERFLRRLRTDPGFAQTYHEDPATALQDEFPELRKVSKDRILESIRAAAGTSPSAAPRPMGMLGAAAAAAAVVAANAFMAGATMREPPPE